MKLPEPVSSAFYCDISKEHTMAFFVGDKVPFGTSLFTADQMRQFREEGVKTEAKQLAIELAASTLETMCDEAPLAGNFNATACALISAARIRRGEQPHFLYDKEEFDKLVCKLKTTAKN